MWNISRIRLGKLKTAKKRQSCVLNRKIGRLAAPGSAPGERNEVPSYWDRGRTARPTGDGFDLPLDRKLSGRIFSRFALRRAGRPRSQYLGALWILEPFSRRGV